jgi:tetratricopeptide (TPR) repeat protein
MDLETRLLHQINDSALTCDERAWLRCELAKQLEEAGHYEEAQDALGDLWQDESSRPQVAGLDQRTAAEITLRVGVLYGWIGSTRQARDAQERSKNLITESIQAFEALGERLKVAEALTDLGYCYWREGSFDEARAVLNTAISRLTKEDSYQRAVALLRSAMVERSTTRFHDALRLHNENAPLVEASPSHALKGKFHNELALVLRNIGAIEHREDYRDRALVEYAAAGFHFEQAGHVRYHACVENNIGFLFFSIGNFTEAQEHLDRARKLMSRLKDTVHIAQVDETRARVLLAQGRNAEAERIVHGAVNALEHGGEQHTLAEALTTQATALARMERHEGALKTFHRAIEIAETAGDREAAGLAALTLIEETGKQVNPGELSAVYMRATELLAESRDPNILARLNACGHRVVQILTTRPAGTNGDTEVEVFQAPRNWHGFNFWKEARRYEKHLIRQALADAGTLVTKASELLGFKHHQSLASLLEGRHKDLLPKRSPIKRRPRKKGRRAQQRFRTPSNRSE